jgi:hypothetical protein
MLLANRATTAKALDTRAGISLSRVALLWFTIALIIRLVAAVALHLYSLSHGFEGLFPLASGSDDITYWNVALALYAGQDVADIPNVYPRVLAGFFRLVGPSLILGKLLNVVAGAVTVYLGVLLVKELEKGQPTGRPSNRAAHWAGFFLTFYPSLLFYSTQLVKDPILVMLGLWALYLGIRFFRHPRLGYAGLWAGAFGGLFLFRFYAALALAISVFIYTLRYRKKWLIPSFVLAGAIPYALGWGVFAWAFLGPRLSLEYLTFFRTTSYSIGGSAAGIEINTSNPITFITSYSYSFATAMFGPFPWQVRSAVQLVALPEAALMWLLFPRWVRSAFRLFRRRIGEAELVMIFSLVLIAAVALFSDNIGANTRLRLLPWSAFLLYVSLRMPRIRL